MEIAVAHSINMIKNDMINPKILIKYSLSFIFERPHKFIADEYAPHAGIHIANYINFHTIITRL